MSSAASDNAQQAASGTVIECTNLGKVYTSGTLEVRALKGIDLVVQRNEFVAIMGPSGSGKEPRIPPPPPSRDEEREAVLAELG